MTATARDRLAVHPLRAARLVLFAVRVAIDTAATAALHPHRQGEQGAGEDHGQDDQQDDDREGHRGDDHQLLQSIEGTGVAQQQHHQARQGVVAAAILVGQGALTADVHAEAEERFLEFQEEWGQKYPAIVRLWSNSWAEFVPFLQFDLVSLSIFAVFYGLDWLATVPPTARLATEQARHLAGQQGRPLRVLGGDRAPVPQHPDHLAQVLEVQQLELVLIGPVEDQPERRLLRRVEAEHLGEQHRTERRHGDAQSVRRDGAEIPEGLRARSGVLHRGECCDGPALEWQAA